MRKFFYTIAILLITSATINAHSIGPKTFNQTIKHNRVVLVKFWASWCVPCSILKPEFEKAKKIVGNKAKMVEYNVDLGGFVLKKYGVQTIPTMILFVNGKPVDQSHSILSSQDIADWVLGYVPN